jgi:DNA-binding NtrC family response regulator
MKSKILIIDNEESIRFTFASFLEDEGHAVVTAQDYHEAMARLEEVKFDLICVGLFLGNDTGIDVLREVRRRDLCCALIVIADYPSVETAVETFRLGACDYLTKPVRQQRLLKAIETALYNKAQREGEEPC